MALVSPGQRWAVVLDGLRRTQGWECANCFWLPPAPAAIRGGMVTTAGQWVDSEGPVRGQQGRGSVF